MSGEERALMQQHATYMKHRFVEGGLLVYGPVLDPEGSFGMAVLQVETEEELRSFIANDPTVRAGMNRYTAAPMLLGGAQGPQGAESS